MWEKTQDWLEKVIIKQFVLLESLPIVLGGLGEPGRGEKKLNGIMWFPLASSPRFAARF
jgi:hypothetical protein